MRTLEDIEQRMHVINKMLLEMASGNFFYRIERSKKNDNIEALVVTLNMLAEEMQDTILHQGYANRDTAILDIVQMSFILDQRGTVQMANSEACTILSMLMEDVVGKLFESFLVAESVTKWKKIWKQSEYKTIFDTSIGLSFRTKADLVIPKIVYLTKFSESTTKDIKTLITVIHHSNYQSKLHSDLITKVKQAKHKRETYSEVYPLVLRKPKMRLSFEDIRKIRKAHDLIMNNPEHYFPPLKKFALQLGTNEFKLKYGFKELYGTTVHHFLMQERLRKAQMMIQYSDRSFNTIAQMSGFKTMSHFSRSFKNKYGFSPSELRKN
ncbi:helix-turn-helix domain-containing protein [Gelidibacter salicanalis]|uniref:Helix-turn-helix domain-containing protein n=1 Tax=Gelidibacter salicanalis TaxID=291193 RepID=A0A934KQH3_9FLAO|nr:helix-turn-helix domain-containing protein [Gelidibacter salicanalis]MBJ7881619.1 helix-turn-helix domain-containing protein [Gelidibacter salicanalis]